jgi:predicted small lipoprotein YifL
MKNNFLFVLFLLLIFILSACGTPAPPAATEAASVSSSALFQIVKPDGTKFDVTLEAVKALPLAQLTAEGKVEEGPYLSDVLALAGVTDFTEITLTGSSNPATLTFEQVDENTILDFNNHGTMKLASTYIPKANWTKDVAKITVK